MGGYQPAGCHQAERICRCHLRQNAGAGRKKEKSDEKKSDKCCTDFHDGCLTLSECRKSPVLNKVYDSSVDEEVSTKLELESGLTGTESDAEASAPTEPESEASYEESGERMQGSNPVTVDGEEVSFTIEDLQSFVYNGDCYSFPAALNVFTDDGWTTDFESAGLSLPTTDSEFGYLLTEDEKYPGIQARIYSTNEYLSSVDDAELEAEITSGGVGGFFIDTQSATGTLPDLSAGGVTWGSSLEDITNTFGSPTYAASSRYSTSYYEITDGSMQYTLMFTADDGGVYGIMLKNQTAAV